MMRLSTARWVALYLGFSIFIYVPCTAFAGFPDNDFESPAYSDNYRSLAFRESPYAPHKGIHRISDEQARHSNHYRFSYDADGRVIRIFFALGEQPRRANHTANYFWETTTESHRYEKDREVVNYFDEWGQSTLVRGTVASSVYRLDAQGRRVELTFHGPDAEPVESDWGISRYHWRHLDDGSVIETRFNLSGQPMPLRPGFNFGAIRLAYDARGFTRLMQHVDEQGSLVGAVDGFVQDRFSYSPRGELVRYEVLDAEGEPASNHQGISSGLLSFTPRGYEHVASYLDVDGNPARNDNGWWLSTRAYDSFGNLTTNAFQDLDRRPLDNPNTGYATAIIDWHDDGLRRCSMHYFDQYGDPVTHLRRGYHAVQYDYDTENFPVATSLVDIDGSLVNHATQGWAVTRYRRNPDLGMPVATRYTLDELRRIQLDAAMEALRQMSRVPGMASAIAIDGEIVWHHESGLADFAKKTPVTDRTVFRLASTSKAVTSILVAQALEADLLTLDSNVSELLPLDHDATLRQLLSHTGSVDHYRATVHVDLDRFYESSRDALSTVEPHLLDEQAGQRYLYSTFGYTLAAAMLEAARGESLPQMLNRLSAQWHTPSLSAPANEQNITDLTRFYDITDGDPVTARPRNFSYAYAGAGMVSNASDLARIMSLFAAARLVSADQLAEMLAPASLSDGSVVRDRNYEVGLGWRRQEGPGGKTWYHHAGVTDGARAIVAIQPASGMAVTILSNASWTSDMFGSAMTLAGLFSADPRLLDPNPDPDPAKRRVIEFEGATQALVFEDCDAVICTWRGRAPGALSEWLTGSDRGSQFLLKESNSGAWLVSPYGLSWFDHGRAGIGSREVVLKTESTGLQVVPETRSSAGD